MNPDDIPFVIFPVMLGAGLVWAVLRARQFPKIIYPLLGMAAATGITTLLAIDPSPGLIALVTWVFVLVFYAILTSLDRDLFGQLLFVLLCALAIVGIGEVILKLVVGPADGESLDYLFLRATAFIMHANVFGTVLLAALAFAMKRYLDKDTPSTLVWMGVFYLTLLLTTSRGAWLGLLSGMLVILITLKFLRDTPILTLAGILLIPLILNPVLVRWLISMQITTSAPVSFNSVSSGRMDVWREAIKMFLEHPLSGVGPLNFRPIVMPRLGNPGFVWEHAHNLYLNTATEQGLFGLLALAGLGATAAFLIWQRYRDGAYQEAGVAAALFVALAVNGLLDYSYRAPGVILLLLLIWNRILPAYDDPPRKPALIVWGAVCLGLTAIAWIIQTG